MKFKSTFTPDSRSRLDTISWVDGSNVMLSGHDYALGEMGRAWC